jgi:hypothetical protein
MENINLFKVNSVDLLNKTFYNGLFRFVIKIFDFWFFIQIFKLNIPFEFDLLPFG